MADSLNFGELKIRMETAKNALVFALEATEAAIAITATHHKICINPITRAEAKFESILKDPVKLESSSQGSWEEVKHNKKKHKDLDKELLTGTNEAKTEKTNPDANNMVKLFETQTQTEAVFLMGIGGRNVSLIRKYTKVGIYIREGGAIWMRFDKNAASDPRKAWRMVLSACGGGILRWFSTPKATQKWYSDRNALTLNAVAETHGCTLELLRSNVGHMCLMLIPSNLQFSDEDDTKPEEASLVQVRAMLPLARQDMLQALTASVDVDSD